MSSQGTLLRMSSALVWAVSGASASAQSRKGSHRGGRLALGRGPPAAARSGAAPRSRSGGPGRSGRRRFACAPRWPFSGRQRQGRCTNLEVRRSTDPPGAHVGDRARRASGRGKVRAHVNIEHSQFGPAGGEVTPHRASRALPLRCGPGGAHRPGSHYPVQARAANEAARAVHRAT